MWRRDNTPYIRNGRIRRRYDPLNGYEQSSYWSRIRTYVDRKRCLYLFLPILVFWCTNPHNEWSLYRLPWIPPPSGTFSSSKWLASMGRPSVTNFGVYSLEDSMEGIQLMALGHYWNICSFREVSSGSLCEQLADNFCHHKPLFLWDYLRPSNSSKRKKHSNHESVLEYCQTMLKDFLSALAEDRVFVIHRLLSGCLILSAVIRYCCPYVSILGGIPIGRTVVDWAASVVWKSTIGNLLYDLLSLNLWVYPCLEEINRLLQQSGTVSSSLSWSWLVCPTTNETVNYIHAVLGLIIGIAGGCNALSTQILQSSNLQRTSSYRGMRMVGLSSLVGASLGYLIRIQSKITWSPQGKDFGYVHAYWTNFVWIILSPDWFPRLTVWFLGGLGGSLYAEFHLEHLSSNPFRQVLQFFRMV